MDKRGHVHASFVPHSHIPHLLNLNQYTYLCRHLHWKPQTQQRTTQLIPHHGHQAGLLRHCHGAPCRKVQYRRKPVENPSSPELQITPLLNQLGPIPRCIQCSKKPQHPRMPQICRWHRLPHSPHPSGPHNSPQTRRLLRHSHLPAKAIPSRKRSFSAPVPGLRLQFRRCNFNPIV